MGRVFSQKDGLFVRLWAWLQELPSYIWPQPLRPAELSKEEQEEVRRIMLYEEIDDKIDAWHNSDSELKLHEYLGWTWDEYRAYVEKTTLPARILK